MCVCGGTLPVSCAPPNGWYVTHCTQAKAHLHFMAHGQRMPDGRGHKKGTAKRPEPKRATPQKVGIASLLQSRPSSSPSSSGSGDGCETQRTAVPEVPLSLCQPTPGPQQGATQSTAVRAVPLSLSDPTPALNLLGDNPPPPSGTHQCVGYFPCGLSRSEFVMVYPFARHAPTVKGTNRKWVAGTEGVRSQRCSGHTENEGPCDPCQQVAGDKDLLRLMHVALGGQKKKQTSLSWALAPLLTVAVIRSERTHKNG